VTAFWLFIAVVVLSSVLSRAARTGRGGGPPPVARPPQRPFQGPPQEDGWPPRPMSPMGRPLAPPPEPPVAPPLGQPRPLLQLPTEAPAPSRPRYPADVEAETRRIAGEAEQVGREAEGIGNASVITADADAMAERARLLGSLRPLQTDIAPADPYAVTGGPVQSDAMSGMPEEVGDAAALVAGLRAGSEVARAVVLAEVVGRPRAWQRRMPPYLRRR